jgi:phosphonate transport system ATP-binding protein
MNSDVALSLRNVRVVYDRQPGLDGVDLVVRTGERVALVGPSGAGKSTLLGLCTGLVQATSGDVEVLGERLDRATPRRLAAVRRRVGCVHQQLHLVSQLRVVHNVNAGRLGSWSLGRAVRSLVSPVEVEKVRAVLERVGISDKLHVRTDRLSGGEQQRVALARVLVQDPDLIVADEPVASLDPARGAEVISLLCEIGPDRRRTLIVSLHDFDLALGYFDRVVGLQQGRILFDLPAAQVRPETRANLYGLELSS